MGQRPGVALDALRRFARERGGGFGALKSYAWVEMIRSTDYGRDLYGAEIVMAIKNEVKREGGCIKSAGRGLYAAWSEEERERIVTIDVTPPPDPLVEGEIPPPGTIGEEKKVISFPEGGEVTAKEERVQVTIQNGRDFKEWEGEKMRCGVVMSKCYQGESCCNSEGCRAARAGGFRTMGELRRDSSVQVVWSWGGGMCGARSKGQ